MKDIKGIRILLLALCLVLVLLVAVSGQIRCKYNEFIVQDVIGNLSCVPCKSCIAGKGLSPECGSYIPYGTLIECKPCVSGVSYSGTYGIESCQPCGICVDHQKVLQKCNKTHNSICSKNCDVGFYLSSVVGDCQECSWCCPDSGPAEYEAACKKDGVPFFKRCSGDEAMRCRPRCTDQQYIIVTDELKQTCYDCPHCGVGQGLYPKCQSVLSSTKQSKCESCVPGKNYSDTTDSSSCKPCKVCGVGKKIERSCNATHDTLCGDCEHGFYNESVEANKKIICQRCSYCCGDGKDIIIPECKAQGMPQNMQCAYTTRALTKCTPEPGYSRQRVIAWALGCSILVLVITTIIIFLCYMFKKYRHEYGKLECNQGESEMDRPQVVYIPHKESPSEASTSKNIEFLLSGIHVRCNDVKTGEELLGNMSVEICWEQHKLLPKRKEIYLSPLIGFHPSGHKVQTSVTLDIPHSAYQQEQNNMWEIRVLKLALPIKSESEVELTELTDDPDIKINPCSVRFTVKELGTYIVVGDPGGDPKRAKKRMQCAVFGRRPKIGQMYSMSLYLLDDGESCFKKLQQEEEKQGRHMLQKLFRSLYPDMDNKSVIHVAVGNLKKGWQGELSNEFITCSKWIDSYLEIPKIEASFKHIDTEIRDFHCTFKLMFEDNTVEIPVFHYFEPESIPTGIQSSDEHTSPPDDLHLSINEQSQAENSLVFLSSVPKEVLTEICQSIDQIIGQEGHARIESVATNIIPSITAEELRKLKSEDQPFTSLIGLASHKKPGLTAADVQHALKTEGLNSNVLMPYLYNRNTSPMV